mgnify:CR=1 FL=1
MSMRQPCTAFAACLALLASPVFAQDFIYDISLPAAGVEPVKKTDPQYPRSRVRRGQEGWVLLNYVITPDGRAADPVIIDSTGGVAFEDAARDMLAEWRFEPHESARLNNMLNIRFELKRGRDMATSNFLRRYRRIVTHLHHQETPEARAAVDQAQELGSWNLYETTMLSLMLGRVDGAEGNMAGKLEHYQRALRVSNRNSLDGEDRRDLLMRMFLMQMGASQYAAASQTLALLRKERNNSRELGKLTVEIDELENKLASMGSLHARGTIYNPCDCEDGEPLWTYRPERRAFSFAKLEGEVERFDLRCTNDRWQAPIEPGKRWTIPENAGFCRIFVFGEDGASFDFVEHVAAEPDIVVGASKVAKNDVLDRRN